MVTSYTVVMNSVVKGDVTCSVLHLRVPLGQQLIIERKEVLKKRP